MNLTTEQLQQLYGLHDGNATPQMISFTVDGNEITCYASYSYFDAKSYYKSPMRGAGGVIENLNSYPTFLTPRLRIKFSLMPLETYRTIMKLIQMKNEVVVECYDIVWNRMKRFKAYFSTEDYPELFTYDLHTLGAIGYEIELQGTNADLDLISVLYHSNPPDGSADERAYSEDFEKGEEVVIGEGVSFKDKTFGGGWKFKEWNDSADGLGLKLKDGDAVKVSNELELYAVWEQV